MRLAADIAVGQVGVGRDVQLPDTKLQRSAANVARTPKHRQPDRESGLLHIMHMPEALRRKVAVDKPSRPYRVVSLARHAYHGKLERFGPFRSLFSRLRIKYT